MKRIYLLPIIFLATLLMGAKGLDQLEMNGELTLFKDSTGNLNARARKQGTLYYDTSTNQVKFDDGSILSPLTSGGGSTFADSVFEIFDNIDGTKIMKFEVSGIATGTTRTITMPDAAVNLSDVNNAVLVNGTRPFTADQSHGGFKITSLGAPVAGTDAATKAYVDSGDSGSIKANGTVPFAANQSMGNFKLTSLAFGTASTDAVNRDQIVGRDNAISDFSAGSKKIISLADPTNPQDAATKNYVDTAGSFGLQVVPNDTFLLWRNFANDADISVLKLDTGDDIQLGNSTNARLILQTAESIVDIAAGEGSGNAVFFAGNVDLQSQSPTPTILRFFGANTAVNAISLRPPNSVTSHTLILPSAQGGASTLLQNDGSGNLSWSTTVKVADGAGATPSIAFTADPDTGFYRSAADTLNISTGGTSRIAFSTSEATLNLSLIPQTNNTFTLGNLSTGYSAVFATKYFAKALGGELLSSLTVGDVTQWQWHDNLPTPSLLGSGQGIRHFTGNGIWITDNSAVADATPTRSLFMETGNKTAGTANSGGIRFKSGTSSGGVRGRVIIDDFLGIGAYAMAPTNQLDVDGSIRLRNSGSTNITADNQVLTVGNRSYLVISSDSAVATDRTIVLTQGLGQGQILMIQFIGTNAAEIVDDSAVSGGGNVRLSSTMTFSQYDTLQLLWDGTDFTWVELSRSAN